MADLKVRDLTRRLRESNDAFDGPATVGLSYHDAADAWHVVVDGDNVLGRESLPGDGKPFDAVAAARRLMATVRDAQEGCAHKWAKLAPVWRCCDCGKAIHASTGGES